MQSNKKRFDLLNMLCRICASEDPNSIPIFGAEGIRQQIMKKITVCLPVHIREDDIFPKQICLKCLTKLEFCWDMHVLCKEAQVKIENKLNQLRRQQNIGQANSDPTPEDPNCGVCNEEVKDEDMGVGCEGPCQKWFHCSCINMNQNQYNKLIGNPRECWKCRKCRSSYKVPRPKMLPLNICIEEKLRNLSERYPVSFGDSAVICLAPESSPPPPPPTAVGTMEVQVVPQGVTVGSAEPVMAPVTYLAPAPAQPAVSAVPPLQPQPSVTEEVYPQTLIQVPQNPANEQPLVYQNRSVTTAPTATPPTPRRRPPIPVPKPMATVTQATPQRPSVSPLKRQNGETPRGPPAKKPCIYCGKYFSDDNIDHHISLHLRQTFSTCLDCDKNFRSEEALQRHRCEVKAATQPDSINLDPDDEEPVVV